MKNAFILALLFALQPAFAAEESDNEDPAVTAAKIEQAYQFLCVPGSEGEKAIPASELKGALEQRKFYLSFLDNPSKVLQPLEAQLLDDQGFFGAFGAAITFGVTCGVTETLHSKIEARGCVSADGKKHSAVLAVKLCAEMSERMKAAEGEE